MRRLRLLVKLCLAWNVAGTAFAQDFIWNAGSARSQAMGGVYLPSSRGAVDSLIANPAGLAAVGSPTIELCLSTIFTQGSFSNSVNSNSALNNKPGLVPYGAFATRLGTSRFSLGVGLLPEITSASKWNYRDSPGLAGANYGPQTEHSGILAGQGVLGMAYSVNKTLSVGASIGAVYNSNTLEAPYIFQSNSTLAGLKTLLRLHTSGAGWNSGVGMIVRPTNRLQMNLSWRSKSTIESTGSASGTLDRQFAAFGLTGAPDFHYSATVRNTLPQTVTAGASLRLDKRTIVAVTGNFVNWSNAFDQLRISLTNGDNSTVNTILSSTSLYDTVPLEWKNQFSIHGGVERLLTEALSLQAGFAHANNPVPASTLSPLTAAIASNRLTTGLTLKHGVWQYNLAYAICPQTAERATQSALKSGEYSNSTVRLGIQSLALDASYRF